MKLHYYPETDSPCVELKAGPGAETRDKTTLKAEINEEAWATLRGDTFRPFAKPHRGEGEQPFGGRGEVMKVFRV